MNGKHSTLLTWFGKSDRPVATMASGRSAATSSGEISGSGLASARITGRSASRCSHSGFSTRGADRPMKMSAPASTSASVRPSVRRAYGAMRASTPSRPAWTTPLMSVSVTFAAGNPMPTSRSTQASAAAPAPDVTRRVSESRLPCSSSALRTAAATVMAVPCWSSWNTGMFMRERSSASIAKHSGALMSSRLTAPKVGSNAATTSQKRAGSAASTSMSNTSMPANFLNSTALPSITGLLASAPILPRPRTAVPLVMTATRLARAV